MALLFIDSFDHYDDPHTLAKWTSQFLATAIGVGKGRCGSNCLNVFYATIHRGIPFGSTRGTVGFALNHLSALSLTQVAFGFLSLADANNTHVFLQWNTDGSLEAFRVGVSNISLGRSASNLVQEDHWYYIECQALIHPSAGEVIVRVNNVVVIAASGVPTVGNNAAVELRQIVLSCPSNCQWRCDDLYVLDDTGPAPCNTFLGDCRVEYLRPRANGTPQQWTLNGTASAHWQAVDDNATPNDDGSYVDANAAGLTEQNLYNLTALPAGPIFGAQLNLLAKKSDAGPRVIAPVVNGAATAPQYAPGYDTYQYYSTVYPTNPATGAPWTIAEINAAQFGVTVVS